MFKTFFLMVAIFFTRSALAMELYSTAFFHNGDIPIQYTCDGQNISPDLSWSDIPKGTQSFALIFDDPDALRGTWTHWVLYNLPSTANSLQEDIQILPSGTQVGTNSWNKKAYGGPCPPYGEHRFIFKLYALDTVLDVDPHMTSDALQQVMKGHVLAESTLLGRYTRK
jgi:Raf kinase inhibitor-like YbhB/YbcL family protein